MKLRLLIALGLAGMTTPSARSAAQRPVPASEPQTITVGTRLVQIDVLVHNKNGPVTGLTRDDFTILDQGKRQEIAVFSSAAEAHEAAVAAPPAPLPPGAVSNRVSASARPVPGATVILLDLVNTQFDHQDYARTQLLKFLAGPRNHEQTAIYALGKSLRVVQDFTDDPEKLLQAVRKFDPKLNELIIPSLEHMDAVDLQMYAMSEGTYAEGRARMTEQAIAVIAQHLAGMSGRKSLIWIADAPGFNGMNFLAAGNINLYPVQVRTVTYRPVQINPWTPGSAASFDGKNIVGVGGPGVLDLQHRNQMVAASRGGVGFADARDIGLAVAQAEEDATHSYTLGFYPSEETLDGKFHTLTVSVVPKIKPGPELRYRGGYFAAARGQIVDPVTTLAARAASSVRGAIESPLNATQIGLTGRSIPDGAANYRVEPNVDLKDLHFERKDDNQVASIELNFLLDGDATLHTATAKIVLTEDKLANALKNGLMVVNSFQAEGPNPGLRVVVRDRATGTLGSLRLALNGSN